MLQYADILEAAMELEQFGSLFQARHAPDLLAIYLQLIHTYPADQALSTRLAATKDRLGPRVLVTGLRSLLGRGQEAPVWLRKECAGRMTHVLMGEGGLRAVLEAFLGGLADGAESLQAHSKVAALLASIPTHVTPRAYVAALAPQIPPLLHSPARDKALVQSLLALVVGRLCQRLPVDTRDLLLFPLLLHPLLLSQATEVEESVVEQAVEDLHVLLTAVPPLPALVETLAVPSLVFPLLELYGFVGRGNALGRQEVEEALVVLLRGAGNEKEGGKSGHVLLLDGYLQMLGLGGGKKRALAFVAGGAGGVALRKRGVGEEEETLLASSSSSSSLLEELQGLGMGWLEKVLSTAEATASGVVVPLLQMLAKDGLEEEGGEEGGGGLIPGRMFERLMLLYLRLKGTTVTQEVVRVHCCQANWDLGEEEKGGGKRVEEEEGETALVRGPVLVTLLEKVVALGPAVLGSGEQIIKCCGLILFLAASNPPPPPSSSISAAEEEEEGRGLEDLVSVVLSLLSVLLEMGEEQRKAKEETALKNLLPLLGQLLHPEEEEGGRRGGGRFPPSVTEMALTVQAMIWTRALSLEQRREQWQREDAAVRARQGMGLEEVLLAIQTDVQSPLVPLRARGLVTLTKVLHNLPRQSSNTKKPGIVVVGEEKEDKKEDNETPPAVEQALDLLLALLKDTDSFVYLAAVQGLAVLSDKMPPLVMDRLLLELAGKEEEVGGTPTPTAAWQYKLKVGEALIQALQRCGEAMPVYAPKAVPAFIKGSQPSSSSSSSFQKNKEEEEDAGAVEEEGHFRASCLSGLADVCELLGWSLQRYRSDVVDLAVSVLTHEREKGGGSSEARAKARTLVRRAAAFLLERLVLGLGSERLLSVLGLPTLQEIMKVLDRTAAEDKDDVTRLHAERGKEAVEYALLQPVYDRMDPREHISLQALTERLKRGLKGPRVPLLEEEEGK